MTDTLPRIEPRTVVESVDPVLADAVIWAGSDPGRNSLYSLAAFVDMLRALDRYRRGERHAG